MFKLEERLLCFLDCGVYGDFLEKIIEIVLRHQTLDYAYNNFILLIMFTPKPSYNFDKRPVHGYQKIMLLQRNLTEFETTPYLKPRKRIKRIHEQIMS